MAKTLNLTFCRRWDLDNVISQTHIFAKAVSNVVDGAVLLDMGVCSQSVHWEVFTQVHLVQGHVDKKQQNKIYPTSLEQINNKKMLRMWQYQLLSVKKTLSFGVTHEHIQVSARCVHSVFSRHLLHSLQGVGIHLGDVVGLCHGVEVLTDWIDVHHAVVCHLYASEVGEEPAHNQAGAQSIFKQNTFSSPPKFVMELFDDSASRSGVSWASQELPGEDVFAGVWVRRGSKLRDHQPLFCHGAHVSICSEEPVEKIDAV